MIQSIPKGVKWVTYKAPDKNSTFNKTILTNTLTLVLALMLTFAPSKQYQSVTISTPELEQGKNHQLYQEDSCNGTQKEGLYTPERLYSSDFGGRLNGGGGGRGGRPDQGFERKEPIPDGQPKMELPPPQE